MTFSFQGNTFPGARKSPDLKAGVGFAGIHVYSPAPRRLQLHTLETRGELHNVILRKLSEARKQEKRLLAAREALRAP